MRAAQAVMADLATSGLSPEQLALVMELSAALVAEARPAVDRAAENKRAYDREYRRSHRKNRSTTSHETNDQPAPNERDILTPTLTPVISDEITPPAEMDDDPADLRPEHVLEAYNTIAERIGLSKARMTPERRKKLSGFIKRHPVDDITEAIHALETSPFLRGENDRGWKANFDFLLQPKSFTRLIEGTYGS